MREFSRAYQMRLSIAWLDSRPARLAASMLTLVPAVVLVVVAAVSSQPLRMSIVSVRTNAAKNMTRVEVEVSNGSRAAITPHFAMSSGYAMSRFWVIDSGPATLEPGQNADYIIVPSTPGSSRSLNDGKLLLRAVSDGPATLSSVRIQ
jgi:hypothetical protein